MGNTSSAKNRHISGDDIGPSLTAGKYGSHDGTRDHLDDLLASGYRVSLCIGYHVILVDLFIF